MESIVVLRRWPVEWSEHSHVTEVVTLMEGVRCYGAGHLMEGVVVTEVVTLMEGALSCYRAGQFKERMVMFRKWSL